MIDREESDLVTIPGDRERRPDVPAVEHGESVLIADEGNDGIRAAIQRHAFQLHGELIIVSPAQRWQAIGVRTNGKALKIIRRSMNADDHVHRLRRNFGVNSKAEFDVFPRLEKISRATVGVAHGDVDDANRSGRPLVLRLTLAGRVGPIALQKKRLVVMNDVEGWTVPHDRSVIEPQRAPADGRDVIQRVGAEQDGSSVTLKLS